MIAFIAFLSRRIPKKETPKCPRVQLISSMWGNKNKGYTTKNPRRKRSMQIKKGKKGGKTLKGTTMPKNMR